MKHAALVLAMVGACSAPTDAVTCGAGTLLEEDECVAPVPMPPMCAAGAHAMGDQCVFDAHNRYEIRVAPKLAANGTQRSRVLVVGTQPDGSPATEALVLNIDRSGAGVYTHPVVTPGSLGAATYFTACEQTVPGCLGPLRLTAALATAPTTVIASTQVELVPPIEVNPAKRCLTGGNILYLKGNDSIFTGETTITGATWTFGAAYSQMVNVTVAPAGATGSWRLLFHTMAYTAYMSPNPFEDARLAWDFSPWFQDADVYHPSMNIRGFGNECSSITGRFDVVTYDVDGSTNTVRTVTLAFEQFCNGSTTASVSGCLHYTQ